MPATIASEHAAGKWLLVTAVTTPPSSSCSTKPIAAPAQDGLCVSARIHSSLAIQVLYGRFLDRATVHKCPPPASLTSQAFCRSCRRSATFCRARTLRRWRRQACAPEKKKPLGREGSEDLSGPALHSTSMLVPEVFAPVGFLEDLQKGFYLHKLIARRLPHHIHVIVQEDVDTQQFELLYFTLFRRNSYYLLHHPTQTSRVGSVVG